MAAESCPETRYTSFANPAGADLRSCRCHILVDLVREDRLRGRLEVGTTDGLPRYPDTSAWFLVNVTREKTKSASISFDAAIDTPESYLERVYSEVMILALSD